MAKGVSFLKGVTKISRILMEMFVSDYDSLRRAILFHVKTNNFVVSTLK